MHSQATRSRRVARPGSAVPVRPEGSRWARYSLLRRSRRRAGQGPRCVFDEKVSPSYLRSARPVSSAFSRVILLRNQDQGE